MNKRVLVVEDDEVSRFMIKTFLKNNNFEVETAENGQIALNILKEQKFSLIFMDIQMPVLDGISTAKRIRDMEMQNGDSTPIIAMTAYALVGDKEKCLEAGMDDYVSKPIDLTRLKGMIRGWIKEE